MKEFKPEKILETLKGGRLSTIVAIDEGQKICLIYYIEKQKKIGGQKTFLPKNSPKIKTISDIHPCGIIFEREIHDLFGVEFEGNKHLHEPLLLPDGWKGKPPLLKNA